MDPYYSPNILAMIKTVGFSEFCDAFSSSDTYKDNFTYKGKRALFDYLEELEEEGGEPIELDIVALCCEYTEYASAFEAMEQYQPEDMPVEGEPGDDLVEIQEKNEKVARKWLDGKTTVIDVDGGGVIIQDF